MAKKHAVIVDKQKGFDLSDIDTPTFIRDGKDIGHYLFGLRWVIMLIYEKRYPMKKLFIFVLLLLQLTLTSCGDSPKQLFETAEFEMLQSNYPHARQLYQEIIDTHPNSTEASIAIKRLAEIKGSE